jgi:hypothetical protein
MSLTGGWRKNPLTLWIIQDAHLEFSMKKLVAGVGFEHAQYKLIINYL